MRKERKENRSVEKGTTRANEHLLARGGICKTTHRRAPRDGEVPRERAQKRDPSRPLLSSRLPSVITRVVQTGVLKDTSRVIYMDPGVKINCECI